MPFESLLKKFRSNSPMGMQNRNVAVGGELTARSQSADSSSLFIVLALGVCGIQFEPRALLYSADGKWL